MKRGVIWLLLAVVATAAAVAAFQVGERIGWRDGPVPPVERITFERVRLSEDGIDAVLRAEGTAPVSIAQVQVDGAFWSFALDPPGPIARLGTARLHIPYPWVEGEPHRIAVLTSTGLDFRHTVEVATETPSLTGPRLARLGLLGLMVGFVPVALGMLSYPALRAGGRRTFEFALALTVGLLAFLLVDTLGEALERGDRAAPALNGVTMVWIVAGLSFAALFAVGRRRGGAPSGLALAASIAFGIGMHNFGEGMAIGAAYALGAATLGGFLVLGFTLHNVTEGIGIVAPVLEPRPPVAAFAGLAAVAGLPAIPGVWIGTTLVAGHWAAFALAIGAGAILQVLVEVGMLLGREPGPGGGRHVGTLVLGAGAGVAVMYGTGLLLQTG